MNGLLERRLRIRWDEKRQLYWVNGPGFDFTLYPTIDFTGGEPAETVYFLECCSVSVDGEDVAFPFKFEVRERLPSVDVVETKLIRSLRDRLPELLG